MATSCAAWPEAAASAPTPPSSEATRSSNAAVVGLDLSLKTYAGASPVRAAAHGRLLDDLRALLHASLRWAREVPLPITGDQRAWDGMVIGRGWRFGIEAEMAARDAQALVRRINLKMRDGGVDGVLLLLRDTHRSRTFVRAARPELETTFSASPREVFASLRAGRCPSGSAILVVPYRPAAGRSRAGGARLVGRDLGPARMPALRPEPILGVSRR